MIPYILKGQEIKKYQSLEVYYMLDFQSDNTYHFHITYISGFSLVCFKQISIIMSSKKLFPNTVNIESQPKNHFFK